MAAVRVRFQIIRNARIENAGKSQSCMVSKLPIIWKQTVPSKSLEETSLLQPLQDESKTAALELTIAEPDPPQSEPEPEPQPEPEQQPEQVEQLVAATVASETGEVATTGACPYNR